MKRVLSKNNESLRAHLALGSLPVKRHVFKISNISIILANRYLRVYSKGQFLEN